MGATSRIDSIDPALRRAGRFDREVLLGIPNQKAREMCECACSSQEPSLLVQGVHNVFVSPFRILCTLCQGMSLQEGLDFSRIAHLTPGYVGADLVSLTREAAMCAVNRFVLDVAELVRRHVPAKYLCTG